MSHDALATAPMRGERSTRLSVLLLPWSLAAVFVLLIGWFRNINLLVLLGYLLAVVPMLNLLAASRALRGLRAAGGSPNPSTPEFPAR